MMVWYDGVLVTCLGDGVPDERGEGVPFLSRLPGTSPCAQMNIPADDGRSSRHPMRQARCYDPSPDASPSTAKFAWRVGRNDCFAVCSLAHTRTIVHSDEPLCP